MSSTAVSTPPSRSLGWLVRALLLGVGAAVLCLGTALPAAAHNSLRSTSPTDEEPVARTPSAVVLTFDEPALAMGTRIVVTGPDGEVQQGPARAVDNTVRQDLRGAAPAGAYTVDWRVTSADGHPISGTFSFTSREAGAARPAASDAPTPAHQHDPGAPQDEDVPPWVWLLVGLALTGTVFGFLRRRRLSRTAG